MLIVWAGAPEDTSEAWEHLDCMLNWLLGYDIDVEEDEQHRGRYTHIEDR
jgi:hypothetical protein